jgi:hypothetical protein
VGCVRRSGRSGAPFSGNRDKRLARKYLRIVVRVTRPQWLLSAGNYSVFLIHRNVGNHLAWRPQSVDVYFIEAGGFLNDSKAGAAPRRRGPRFGARPGKASAKTSSAPRTPVDGIMFDSAKEARRYQQLRLEERAGHITDLKLQVPFPITATRPNGERVVVAKYIADFTYERHLRGRRRGVHC